MAEIPATLVCRQSGRCGNVSGAHLSSLLKIRMEENVLGVNTRLLWPQSTLEQPGQVTPVLVHKPPENAGKSRPGRIRPGRQINRDIDATVLVQAIF